jgi:hypothetical protein
LGFAYADTARFAARRSPEVMVSDILMLVLIVLAVLAPAAYAALCRDI